MLSSLFTSKQVDICEYSDRIFKFWQSGAPGWAPIIATQKLSPARLDWMSSLTKTLSIWIDKGDTLTAGELLLAYANLGALVEGWLKLFYCIYYKDYLRSPRMRKGVHIEPNELKFEDLKQYSCTRLWPDSADPWYLWVEKVQLRRNAIHAFNTRDIGTASEFQLDAKEFGKFIMYMNDRLPYPDTDLYP